MARADYHFRCQCGHPDTGHYGRGKGSNCLICDCEEYEFKEHLND